MFEVTFSAPVKVSADQLAALLSLADAPVTVKPYVNGEEPTVPTVTEVVQTPAGAARRGRKSNAEKAAEAAAANGGNAGTASTEDSGTSGGEDVKPSTEASKPNLIDPPAVDTDLLNRFTSLVDKDYDSALKLLEGAGVARFSDLKPEQHASVAEALTALGV